MKIGHKMLLFRCTGTLHLLFLGWDASRAVVNFRKGTSNNFQSHSIHSQYQVFANCGYRMSVAVI